MSEEKIIETYEEYKKANGNSMVKGLGRLMAYQGLDYIEKLLENDEIYTEKLEDSIVGIESYVISKENEIIKQKEVLDKIKPMLEELKNLYDDNYTVSDKVGDILELLEEIE